MGLALSAALRRSPSWLVVGLVGLAFGVWFSVEQVRAVSPELLPRYPVSLRAVTVIECASLVTFAFAAVLLGLEWLRGARLSPRWELGLALATAPLVLVAGGVPVRACALLALGAILATGVGSCVRASPGGGGRRLEVVLVLAAIASLNYLVNDGVSPRLSEDALTQGCLNLRNVSYSSSYRAFVWTKQLAFSDDDYSFWGCVRRSPTSIQSIPLLLGAFLGDVPSLDVAGYLRLLHQAIFWQLVLGSFGFYLYVRFGLGVSLPASVAAGLLFVFGNVPLEVVYASDGPVFVSSFVVLPYGLLLFRLACRSGRPLHALWSGAAMASQFYLMAPHPEGAILSVMAYAAVALGDALAGEPGDRPRATRVALLLAVGASFTLASAAYVVPLLWQLRSGAFDVPGHQLWGYAPTHAIRYPELLGRPWFYAYVALALVLGAFDLVRQLVTGRRAPATWGFALLSVAALSLAVEGVPAHLDRLLGVVGLHVNFNSPRCAILLALAQLVFVARGVEAFAASAWERASLDGVPVPRGRRVERLIDAAPKGAAVLAAVAGSAVLLAVLRAHVLWRTPRQQLSQTLGVAFVVACGLAALPLLQRASAALFARAPLVVVFLKAAAERLGARGRVAALYSTGVVVFLGVPWTRFPSHHRDDNPRELPYHVTLAANVANYPGLAGDRANVAFLRSRLERFERDVAAPGDELAREHAARYAARLGGKRAALLGDDEVFPATAAVADTIDDFTLARGVHPHVYADRPLPSHVVKYGLDGLFTAVPGRTWRVCGATGDHRWLGLGPGLLLHNATCDADPRVFLGYPLVHALYLLPGATGAEVLTDMSVCSWDVSPALLLDPSARKRLAIGGVDAYVVPTGAALPEDCEVLPVALAKSLDDGLRLVRDRRSYGVTYLARSATGFDAELAARAEASVRLRARDRIGAAEYLAALAPLRDALLGLRERHDVVVEGAAPALGTGEPGAARLVGLVGPRIAVEVVSERDRGLLVLNVAALPGWRAWIDDRPAPVRRANFGFLGVEVPRGRHLVWFVHGPWAEHAATVASLCAFAALAVAARRGVA